MVFSCLIDDMLSFCLINHMVSSSYRRHDDIIVTYSIFTFFIRKIIFLFHRVFKMFRVQYARATVYLIPHNLSTIQNHSHYSVASMCFCIFERTCIVLSVTCSYVKYILKDFCVLVHATLRFCCCQRDICISVKNNVFIQCPFSTSQPQ